MRIPSRTQIICIAIAAGLTSACVSADSRGTSATGAAALVRRFVLDYEHVPAPPADAGDNVRTAWQALRAGDSAGARLALDAVADGNNAAARVAEGFWRLARGAMPEARAQFQRALELHPGYASALYGLGFAAEAEGDRVAGLDWYRRAVEADMTLSPAAVRLQVVRLERAQAFIVQGERAASGADDATALSAYEAARGLAPGVLEPYLRIAAIQRRGGDIDAAIGTLRAARNRLGEQRIILEPLGAALQESGAYADAYDVFQALAEVAPDDADVRARLAAARELYFTTSLPQPYRELERQPEIRRGDLAALIAIRLPELGERVDELHSGIIAIDIDDSWARDYILEVVAWGVMQVFQNHAFGPDLVVKRQYFAEVVYRVLELLDATEGAAPAQLSDVSTEHYFYHQIGVVVGMGILELGPRGNFGLLEPVSGQEAIAAVQRLVRLARGQGER